LAWGLRVSIVRGRCQHQATDRANAGFAKISAKTRDRLN
jgi:hypothetical protein